MGVAMRILVATMWQLTRPKRSCGRCTNSRCELRLRRELRRKTRGSISAEALATRSDEGDRRRGAIRACDLLTSSSTLGYAMRCRRMLGAVVAKALESLREGEGVIQVLVTLQ